jgi:hypothetical protein
MDKMTKAVPRIIIEDYANDINERKSRGPKPSTEIIFFRKEHLNNYEREVWELPTELLRFRKDNGRISSDIFSYERKNGSLKEESSEAQKIIRDFLEKKDPEKTGELKNSILHTGQRDPAIITADGFLINGNRRKMVLDKLYEETKSEKFKYMKVVILPGVDDEGGRPTHLEIEQLENRYQLQSEGKADYYNFDKALSMRRKIDLGMSLEEQLRDDPNFAKLPKKEFGKVVKKYEDEFINPLECIDRYLDQLNRQGLYYTISSGMSDKEGRWQAFLDYYNHVYKKIEDENKRVRLGIEEDEIGDIEEIAFKIIRKRDFPDLPKVHKIMIDLPKWLENPDAKKELKRLLDINIELDKDEIYDEDGNEHDERKKDLIWAQKNQNKLIYHVKKAKRLIEYEKETENALSLLETALKKLEHENMDPKTIKIRDLSKALKLAEQIRDVADDLKEEFYKMQKGPKKLKEKFNSQ